MKRTSLKLDEALLRRLKQQAAAEGRSLQDLANQLLRREDIRAVLASPSLVLLSQTPRHAEVMQAVISESGATGNLMHDAHSAALCFEHGVPRADQRTPGLPAVLWITGNGPLRPGRGVCPC